MSDTPKAHQQAPPLPVTTPHPLRFAIVDVTDKIADLKAFVAAQECDEHLKAFILSELGEIKTNAATINLHDVERLDGGFDLHLSVAARHLGSKQGSVSGSRLTKGQGVT